jgi:spoIIIJ-associated protein
MALSTAQRVASENEPQAIYNLKNSERRVIHVALTNHPSVETISEGEGENRHIIVKPRN